MGKLEGVEWKSYNKGFKDAVDVVENTVNETIAEMLRSGNSRESLVVAVDKFISLAYILKFQVEQMKEEI